MVDGNGVARARFNLNGFGDEFSRNPGRAFLIQHEVENRAGKKFALNDPAVTPDLVARDYGVWEMGQLGRAESA